MSSMNDPDPTSLRRTITMNSTEFEAIRSQKAKHTTSPPPSIGLLLRSTSPPPPPSIEYPLGRSVPRTGFGTLMDQPNAKALDVMEKEGCEAGVKHMFTRPDGSTRSYSEMRMKYG